MYLKKNLMLWLAVFAMALPLLFVGTASAKYQSDGAVADPTGTAGFITPSDGICVTGLHADGTMDYVAHATIDSKRGCIYYNTGLTSMDPADVTATHAGIVLTSAMTGTYGYDQSYAMCKGQSAPAGKTYVWNFTTSKCMDVTACNGGTLVWNAASDKCYDTARCTTLGAAGNDGAKHAIASTICVDGSGNGISLKDLDRTFAMCAAKGGTWKQATDSLIVTSGSGTSQTVTVQVPAASNFGGSCVAYGWQYRYQDAAGQPLPMTSKGVAQAANTGFCYTAIRTGITPTTSCPSATSGSTVTASNTKLGYSVSGSNCNYAYGTAGVLNANLMNIASNGTVTAVIGGVTANAGATVDLTGLAQGECIANGATWANGWGFVNTGVDAAAVTTWPNGGHGIKFDQQVQALNADEGCLHCHSSVDQANGPAERQKDSYLKSGHKNMLRKVVAGQKLVGPDGLVYTTSDGVNVLDFTNATVTSGATVSTLTYVYGDWMAALPTIAYPGANYNCAACHSTGYSDATNPGVQSIGMGGYTAAEPLASGASYSNSVAAGVKWDLEGITCGRCHNATVPAVTSTQIAASANFKKTAPTNSGMGSLAYGTGRNNLCFGCHGGGSMAKAWPAQGGTAAGATQYDPTPIATGVSHGAAAGRDFNGHILGQSFLSSPHALYSGISSTTANGGTSLNSMGKYDLFDPNGTTEYGSTFKGYTCWQSPTSSSPGKTKADGTEIKTKSECEALYGAGSWRADTGDRATVQGTCTTCHDIHNSLFVADQTEKAIRKTCADCHVNNATTGATDAASPQVASTNHPAGAGSPFDPAKYESGCVTCHMAVQAEENGNQNSMPVHVWRISTDVNYNTFPTTAQFYGFSCDVHTGAVQNAPYLPAVYSSDTSTTNCTTAGGTWTAVTKDRNAQTAPDGTYTKAVWVDLDLACGQCHGGSFGASKTANNAPYFTKSYLSAMATGMHAVAASSPTVKFSMQTSPIINFKVRFDASASICPAGPCQSSDYAWDFGDGAIASGATPTHTYADATPRTVTLTLTGGASKAKTVTPVYVASSPTTLTGLSVTPGGFSPTINWTVGGGVAPYKVRVNFGDGTTVAVTQPAAGAGSLAHTYSTSGTFHASVYAVDSGDANGNNKTSQTQYINVTIAPSASTVSGLVVTSTGTPVSGAAVTLTNANNVVKYLAYTNASGAYMFTGVMDKTWTLMATKNKVSSTPVSITTSGVFSAPTITIP